MTPPAPTIRSITTPARRIPARAGIARTLAALALALPPAACDRGPDPAASAGSEPRTALLPLEGVIGIHIRADVLADAIDVLDAMPAGERPDTVILRIDSPGGHVAEVPPIVDLIHDRLLPRCRTIAHVDQAVSAAALIAMAVPELTMSPGAALGAAVTIEPTPDGPRALAGGDLETMLEVGRIVAARGGHDPRIVEAMQRPVPLSCTIGGDGTVTWSASDDGQVIVNAAGDVLTLNAAAAERCGIARIGKPPSMGIAPAAAAVLADAHRSAEAALGRAKGLADRIALLRERGAAEETIAAAVAEGGAILAEHPWLIRYRPSLAARLNGVP